MRRTALAIAHPGEGAMEKSGRKADEAVEDAKDAVEK